MCVSDEIYNLQTFVVINKIMIRKTLVLLFCVVCTTLFAFSQNDDNKPLTVLLTGASFASPNNGWFELGCELINATPVNRAIGGQAIADTANRIIDGSLYSNEELESIDALVIMQVHDRDVFEDSQILDKHEDYETPFDRSNYAAAFDYVIKKYLTDCFNLQFDENSKYYNIKSGKPAVVILCTHWHDSREIYNNSVRKLADKWGFPLVEFDKYIGFSKNTTHPVTGEQVSLLFSNDSQEIDGERYGWHPQSGKDKYIQQRMGALFADTMRRIFPVR